MLMRLIKHIANRINRCNIFIALCIQTLYLSIVLNIDDTLSTCMAAEKDSFVRFRHTQHIDDIVLTSVAIFAVHVLLPQASTEYRPIGSCREQSEPGHAMATSQHTQPHQLPI